MAALCLPGPIKPTIHFKWSIEVFPDLRLTSKQELKIKLDYCLLTSLNHLSVKTALLDFFKEGLEPHVKMH